MGARGEALAKQFEVKAQEATAIIESLSDVEWKKTTSAEKWPVGVVVHHVAEIHGVLGDIIKTIADGKPMPELSMDKIHAMNAQHAKANAGCSKADTLALHKKNAASVAAMVRGLGDDELDRRAVVIPGLPEMAAGELAGGLLVGHIDEHLGSIRVTIRR